MPTLILNGRNMPVSEVDAAKLKERLATLRPGQVAEVETSNWGWIRIPYEAAVVIADW